MIALMALSGSGCSKDSEITTNGSASAQSAAQQATFSKRAPKTTKERAISALEDLEIEVAGASVSDNRMCAAAADQYSVALDQQKKQFGSLESVEERMGKAAVEGSYSGIVGNVGAIRQTMRQVCG